METSASCEARTAPSPYPTNQFGTGLVWIPAAIWLGYKGATAALVFTIVWNLGVNVSDNVIKPWLIGRGSSLPLAVIFLGVLGGLLAWGFLGMFLGAPLLSVAYELFRRWVDEQPAQA
jgi:predicted PurR-regulated permease PerM